MRQELAEKCEAYANLQKELVDSKKLTEDLKQQLAQAQLMKATPTRNRLADSILHVSFILIFPALTYIVFYLFSFRSVTILQSS